MSNEPIIQLVSSSISSDVVIKVENVSKKFCKKLKKSMFYGLQDIGKNMLGLKTKPDFLRPDEFWALDDVSFEVKRGETLGLIGPNGSGKTTLLKMLNGIFWPDKGKISIKGKVGALIAVGAGFHPQLTGRENIYVNAAILGMNRQEVNQKFDKIVEFADIGDFLDMPVSHYSSGMFVRLGFAVAVYCEPDILLVDEVLAVGDISFQRKSYNKINELKAKGSAILLVSHSIGTILNNCQNTLFLKRGELCFLGTTKKAINIYLSGEKSQNKNNNLESASNIVFFTDNVINLLITEVNNTIIIKTPSGLDSDFYIGISIKDSFGMEITGYNTKWDNKKYSKENKDICIKLNTSCLSSGIYSCVIDVRDEMFGIVARNDKIILNLYNNEQTLGLMNHKYIFEIID